MRKTIKLTRTPGGWVATFSDPSIMELFGADTIPLPYTAQAEELIVLEIIKRRNPNAIVTVGRAS